MDDKESHAAFISAMTTEHFVLQTAANATVSEAAARSSLYVFSLSSALVAMGFASQSREVFVPFIATVLPAIFMLGLLTFLRLVDTTLENMRCLLGIAHIRRYYRTLSPEGAMHFAAHRGRWPERHTDPVLQLGPLVAFLSTSASMIAGINSLVAGVGIALLASRLLGADRTVFAMVLGVVLAIGMLAASVAYERWRFRLFEAEEPNEGPAER